MDNEETKFSKEDFMKMFSSSESDTGFSKGTDMWFPLFTALLLFAGFPSSNNANVMLEKEVAYLRGELDTIKEMLMKNKDSQE